MMFGLSWRLTVLALFAIPLLAVMSDYYGDYYEVRFIGNIRKIDIRVGISDVL